MLVLCLLGDTVRDASVEAWSAPVSGKRRRRVSTVKDATPSAVDRRSDRQLLSVVGLSVSFPSERDSVRVVDGVSFDVDRGETVGIVGESGCGKTVTASAILGLLPGSGQIDGGFVWFEGRDLTTLPEAELQTVRGREIALVSQEPMVSLDPAFRVGSQIEEALRQHLNLSRAAARSRCLELLADVHLSDPAAVARRYPHELSGGMAQRVAIARALSGEPKLLIADEPTTALDVTVQAEILDLLRELQRDRKMAVLIVTHDWGVVADTCDRVVVMYAGQVVERSEVDAVFSRPLHPYTKALLTSNPHHAAAAMLPTIPGTVPAPGSWPTGCRFRPRCAYAEQECAQADIPLQSPFPAHETRCINYEQLIALSRTDRAAPARSD
jgi:peptide/nickel transport system permease protein